MENQHSLLLLLMTFLPMIGGIVVLLAQPPKQDGLSRYYALASSLATLAISLFFFRDIFTRPGEYFAVVNYLWIEDFNIRLLMGMDGLSGTLVLLTNILVVLSVLCSWTAIETRRREFYCFLLLLQTGILGTFLALDLILFYVFWEMMLIPLYFMIGIFGSGRRIYATMKFFLYTFAGSVLMLIGILAIYFYRLPNGEIIGTFALTDAAGPGLLTLVPQIAQNSPDLAFLIFCSFLLAFMIKVPLFPLHTWLPDAHTEAPTAGSVILAGVLLKTGVYGLMRFAIPLFPAAAVQVAPLIVTLALIGIIYGALTAFAQTDMKRLIAYSSVSHMGFIVLGLFAFTHISVTGAALQMLNHGVSTGGLFLAVGYIYERRHTREMSEFGGLAHNMKIYAILTIIIMLSSVGLPGLNGFVGEFLILLGASQANLWWAVIAASGVILAACYLLRWTQAVFYGPLDNEKNKKLSDLNAREIVTLATLAALALIMGVYSKPFTATLEPASRVIVSKVQSVTSSASVVADAGVDVAKASSN